MYNVQLTESLFVAEADHSVREITIGDLLREVAAEYPSALALVEVKPEGDTRRRWTSGELLSDSEKLALALSTRFHPGEQITIWAPNIPEWLLMEYA